MGYILYSGFGRLDRNLSSLEPLCFGMEVLFHLNQSPVVGEFILVVFRDKDNCSPAALTNLQAESSG